MPPPRGATNNAKAVPGARQGSRRGRLLKHEILVVDDDHAMRVLLTRLLEGEGHAVETAVDAADALSRFRRGKFSLVISDVVMPGASGIELRAAIAERDPDLPCVLVSGADIDRGLRYAASTYRTVFLAKPFEPDELLRLLNFTPHDRTEVAAS
jgi:DNA-binding NtrC family response regulator